MIFSWIANQSSLRKKKILIISHRQELLTQAGGTLTEFGVFPFLITAKTKKITRSSVSVAMTNTLKNRMELPEWQEWWDELDLIIIDECHRSEFNWITKYEKSILKLGVTATPKRSGKMPQLSDEYDAIVYGPDTQELINRERLTYDRYFGAPVDISGVGRDSKGEYNTSELYGKYNNTTLYAGIISNWKRICEGVSTICFCVNIQHCIETTIKLNKAGIKAKFITSQPGKPKLPKTDNKASWTLYERKLDAYNSYKVNKKIFSGDRAEIIEQWKRKEFPILVNAGILVEGFDHRATMAVIINLSTTSENKWLQMLGRASRTFDGKKYFYVLDFGENADRLGHYRQERDYSLHHSESKGDGVAPSKNCPKCDALVLASAQVCKYCGYIFEKTAKEKLVELVEQEYMHKKPQELDVKNMSIRELELYCEKKGYKRAFLWRLIYINLGMDELKKYAKRKGYHWAWAARVAKQYERKK